MTQPHAPTPKAAARHAQRHEIDSLDALTALIEGGAPLDGHVVHGLDLTGYDAWEGAQNLDGALFLGCVFADRDQLRAIEDLGAYVVPRFEGLPYEPFRTTLYSVDELMEGYDDGGYVGTRDFSIYTHFDRHRRASWGVPIRETLAQRIHDHAIDDALLDVLDAHAGRGVVGVMGGHGTRRTDTYYRKVAYMTWELTRRGYLVASGGGPGIMEAANLGAYLAHYANPKVVDAAIAILSKAPKFDGGQPEGTPAYLAAIADFMRCARQVVDRFGPGGADPEDARRFARESDQPGRSLAIPTWFYGHEPSNLFSDHVAKYFSNSIREDGLLAISLAGVVFAPGSAGTLQEVFMDLAQNHYATFEWRSPMVFLGRERFEPFFDLIQSFIGDRGMTEVYGDMVSLFDDPLDVVDFIEQTPPRLKEQAKPLYELVEG